MFASYTSACSGDVSDRKTRDSGTSVTASGDSAVRAWPHVTERRIGTPDTDKGWIYLQRWVRLWTQLWPSATRQWQLDAWATTLIDLRVLSRRQLALPYTAVRHASSTTLC
jgi:hypothetical protein